MMIEQDKIQIIELFRQNIKNKKIELEKYNKKHNGKEGYWLEEKMNIDHNSKNQPDINGYEMKKDSRKITFGDFSASEYLFSKNKKIINKVNGFDIDITRDTFIKIFGTKKSKKHNRYSWSGDCVPKYNIWNKCGQKMVITDDNNICICYSYLYDERNEIKINFPECIKKDNILIVIWTYKKLGKYINNKFNKKGFFIIKKKNNFYNKICFGKAFDYDSFIEGIKNNKIIFDSGMYIGNNRNYSHFRTNTKDFWNELIIEEYE